MKKQAVSTTSAKADLKAQRKAEKKALKKGGATAAAPAKSDKASAKAEKPAAAPTKKPTDLKSVQRRVSEFLADCFGFADHGEAFYITPPGESPTRLAIFVLRDPDEVAAVVGRFQGVQQYTVSGEVLAILEEDATESFIRELIQKGDKAGKIGLVYETTFDPRGINPETWSTKELQALVVAEQLLTKDKAAEVKRDGLIKRIYDFFYGDTDGGANLEDQTDAHGEALAKVYDKLVLSKAVRGEATLKRQLQADLKEHRADLFDKGRKTRIGQLRKLIKTADLTEKVEEEMLDILTAAATSED